MKKKKKMEFSYSGLIHGHDEDQSRESGMEISENEKGRSLGRMLEEMGIPYKLRFCGRTETLGVSVAIHHILLDGNIEELSEKIGKLFFPKSPVGMIREELLSLLFPDGWRPIDILKILNRIGA